MRKEITLHLSFGFCKSFSVRHSQVFSKSIDHLKIENSSGGYSTQCPTPYPFVYHLNGKGSPLVYLSLKKVLLSRTLLRKLHPFSKPLE